MCENDFTPPSLRVKWFQNSLQLFIIDVGSVWILLKFGRPTGQEQTVHVPTVTLEMKDMAISSCLVTLCSCIAMYSTRCKVSC